MKWLRMLALAALVGPLPDSTRAQGSGSVGGGTTGGFQVVRQVDGTLVSVDEGERVIVLEEKKTGKQLTLPVDPEIKLRADKNSSLGGRRDLTLASFTAGQPVRISLRTTDQVVVEMKLKKPER
jgi:hypothetical protein